MSTFREFWNKLIGKPASSDQVMRRDKWTRDIVRLMFFVVMIATGVILIGVFAGVFTFSETLAIYVIFVCTTIAYIGARNNGWAWVRFLPVIICLSTGLIFFIR